MQPGDDSDARLFAIVEVLQAQARLEFSTTAAVSERGDLFDAIAAGVNALGEELAAFHREVEDRAEALSVANAELAHRALYDALTGLANRALLQDRLTQAMASVAPGRRGVAVLVIDLDGFKELNDSLGHAAGDRMLIEVARRLRQGIRARDTAARIGGDEFAVLLVDVSPAEAERIAVKLIGALRRPVRLEGQMTHGSASAGLAIGEPGQHPEQLQQNAEVALYAAKEARTGIPQIYQPGMHDPVIERQQLSSSLRAALDNGDLRLAYQPIIDIQAGSIAGFEALARWRHPTLGDVPPATFIPLAERIGVMPQLGELVLEMACREAATWRALSTADAPYVAVNLSAIQLADERLPERVAALLKLHGLPPRSLMLEITESQLMEHMADATDVLQRLRDLGTPVAIDDFGTGYSSLSYLRQLPVSVVKIDRAFIAGIGTGSEEWSFAQAVVRLVRRLSLATVAEGVEDAVQLAHARAIGCDFAQGYYFGRPGDAASVHELLQTGLPAARRSRRAAAIRAAADSVATGRQGRARIASSAGSMPAK